MGIYEPDNESPKKTFKGSSSFESSGDIGTPPLNEFITNYLNQKAWNTSEYFHCFKLIKIL